MNGLKDLRRKKGLTQADLAVKLGVTQSLVAMWERGAVMPSAAKLPEIANMLGCTIDQLYGRGGPERPSA